MRKQKVSNKRNLTELEGVVLGLIGINGPCTPYMIRKELKKSPSPYWKGSAGTIYPIIERLSAQKLIEHTSTKDNLRGGKLYIVSKTGERVLKDWVYQPTSLLVTGLQPDAIRTRVEFIEFLTPELRKNFLDEAARELEKQVEFFELFVNKQTEKNNLLGYLVSRGSLLTTRARLDWIREVSNILNER